MKANHKEITQKGYLDDYRFQWRFLAPKFWAIWFLFGVLFVLGRLPLPALTWLGARIGDLFFKLGGSRLRTTLTNLELCFPELSETERKQLARKNYQNLGFALLEPGIAWWSTDERMRRISKVEGYEEHIKPLMDKGQSVILFGLHMTCVEAIARLAGVIGINYNILYRVHDNPLYEYLTGIMRRKYAGRFIPRKQVKEMLAFVKQGEVGIILPDQDMGRKRSLWIPFFNTPAATIPVASDYAQQTAAVASMITYHRDEHGHYVLNFSPPLENFPSDNLSADTLRVNRMTEDYIRLHPEQYLWQHRRFKHRPEGEPKIYK